ncbi:MAG: hypothetical protein A2Y77_03125, partial [Planctomycetes bacterium RBG_13_62_9]
MRSLRARLLAGVIGGMILLLTVFSLLLYAVISGALINQFDTSLASVAQILAASVESDEDEIELEMQRTPELQDAGRPTYYQIWGPDGQVVAKSPLLGTHSLLWVEAFVQTPVFRTSRDADGKPQRTISLKFVARAPNNGEVDDSRATEERLFTLAVARDAGDLQGQLRFLRWLLVIASVVVIALSFLIGELIVRRGLRPLGSLAAEIAAIRADTLTTQIGGAYVPSEVIPIRDRLNELLSRLEASFNRERQFNADVAHELRTPLAGIRSTIEVTLTRNREAAEYRTALGDCLEITQGMQSVVNNLLLLARVDARQISFQRELIQLAGLVNSCWHSFADRAHNRQIVFENRVPVEVTCQSDSEHLSMVFSNLLGNAVEYADEGGRIWTTARTTDDSTIITVSNTGCRLTEEQVSHVFDCFWRGDASRPGTGTHCGVGLALTQRLVEALGGHVAAELQ